MPIYEYVCQSCGAEIEVLHGLNAPGPAACDVCGGPMRKRLAAPAIVFRGSGWAKKERREAAASGSGKKKDEASGSSGDGAKVDTGAAGPSSAGTGEEKGGTTPKSTAKDASSG